MQSLISCIKSSRRFYYSYISYITSSGKQYHIIYSSTTSKLICNDFLLIKRYYILNDKEDYVLHYHNFCNKLLSKDLIIPLDWINNIITVYSPESIAIEYKK